MEGYLPPRDDTMGTYLTYMFHINYFGDLSEAEKVRARIERELTLFLGQEISLDWTGSGQVDLRRDEEQEEAAEEENTQEEDRS
jgi:hypothetical protein